MKAFGTVKEHQINEYGRCHAERNTTQKNNIFLRGPLNIRPALCGKDFYMVRMAVLCITYSQNVTVIVNDQK
jgi:hypothetical protein